jgi:hypothetical protein
MANVAESSKEDWLENDYFTNGYFNQCLPLEADNYSADQNSRAHSRDHNSLSLDIILSHLSPVHIEYH